MLQKTQEEKIDAIFKSLERRKSPWDMLRIWLPTVLLVIQIIGGAWWLGRFYERTDHVITTLQNQNNDLRIDVNVVIAFLEDSTSYNHDDRLYEYLWRQEAIHGKRKSGGTRGVDTSVESKKKAIANNR